MLMNVASGEHLRRRSVLPRLRSGQRRQRWKRVRANTLGSLLGTNLLRRRSPEPLVSFPGAYTGYEPGILIVRPSVTMCMTWMKPDASQDIWNLPRDNYTYVAPGPAVWNE